MTFRLLRYYSVASLVAVVLAAVAIVAVYRAIAIRGIESIAENSNLAVANLAIAPIRAQLADYLSRASDTQAPDGATPRLPLELDSAIDELMKQGHVVRVKLYNRHGVVSYSTK